MVDSSKYVVLDIETTGIKPEEDDIISISLYKPDDGKMYNRFLPLEKGFISEDNYAIHHISEADLIDKEPLTQDEVFKLIIDFELSARTILTFGGRNFDKRFILQYCKEHDLVGFDYLDFFDFQAMIHSSGDRLNPASKDNLCIAFGIKGVRDVHSSAQDCILEWELFKEMDGSHILVTGSKVFKLTPEYIFPASYIDRFSRLREYAGIPKRHISTEKVFELKLTPEETEGLEKFPNNFTGNAIEHLINTMLGAKKIDSRQPLLDNKMKLTYIGSFDGISIPVYTEQRNDGSVALSKSTYDHAIESLESLGGFKDLISILIDAKAHGGFNASLRQSEVASKQYDSLFLNEETLGVAKELLSIKQKSMLTDAITDSNRILKDAIPPLIEMLKKVLGSDVMSQELIVNTKDNCLALCDLSSKKAVVEIKTGWKAQEAKRFVNQLYYSANGRDCYLLYIKWGDYDECLLPEEDVTSFILEKVSFTTDKPKRKNPRKKQRIRHAVMDWRQLNPLVNDYKECALDLQILPNDVEKEWEKSNPKSFPTSVYDNASSRRNFSRISKWRVSHPYGSRLDLHDDLGIQLVTVEKWWYLASPANVSKGDENSKSLVTLQSIKESISDISDIANTYSLLSFDDIWRMRLVAEQKGRLSGLAYSDPYSPNYSLPYYDELKDDSKREQCAKELKKFIVQCDKRIESGYKTLRIPLSMTSYKTRDYYYPLNPSAASIKKGIRKVVVRVTNKKVASLSPNNGAIYKQISSFVERNIIDAYIERSFLTDSSDLVFVFKD